MTTDPQNKPLVVLVDFDGTITNQDVGDQVVIKFSEPGWKEALYKQLFCGKIAKKLL